MPRPPSAPPSSPAAGNPLRSGTVCEVRRRETTAGAHTTITVQDRADPARTLRLEAGDEYVLVLDDGVPLAVTPEVICVLDPRTWRLIPPYAVTEHQRVALFALPAAPAWRPPVLLPRRPRLLRPPRPAPGRPCPAPRSVT
ncbi:S-methyl thiohydantoin desulfurase domain-containing protein [Streptomyces somaliensis]|uniref:S-methyl thiohydantoin desulfurase domain-containing protein n=1 Tax=Streptomyces somaliensis TaxID=78355 RepID=UPI0034E94D2E